jgi:hypothetical protein
MACLLPSHLTMGVRKNPASAWACPRGARRCRLLAAGLWMCVLVGCHSDPATDGASNASGAAQAEATSCEPIAELQRWLDEQQDDRAFRSPLDVLSAMVEQKRVYPPALVYRSFSAFSQQTSPMAPRVVAVQHQRGEKLPEMFFASNWERSSREGCAGLSSDSHASGTEMLEAIAVCGSASDVSFVPFTVKAVRARGAFAVDADTSRTRVCLDCHQDGSPITGGYPLWPNMYGSQAQTGYASAQSSSVWTVVDEGAAYDLFATTNANAEWVRRLQLPAESSVHVAGAVDPTLDGYLDLADRNVQLYQMAAAAFGARALDELRARLQPVVNSETLRPYGVALHEALFAMFKVQVTDSRYQQAQVALKQVLAEFVRRSDSTYTHERLDEEFAAFEREWVDRANRDRQAHFDVYRRFRSLLVDEGSADAVLERYAPSLELQDEFLGRETHTHRHVLFFFMLQKLGVDPYEFALRYSLVRYPDWVLDANVPVEMIRTQRNGPPLRPLLVHPNFDRSVWGFFANSYFVQVHTSAPSR